MAIDFVLVIIRVDGKKQPCLEAALAWPHELPHIWDWLKVANNTGSDRIDGHEVQIWNYTVRILILHYLLSFPPFFPFYKPNKTPSSMSYLYSPFLSLSGYWSFNSWLYRERRHSLYPKVHDWWEFHSVHIS